MLNNILVSIPFFRGDFTAKPVFVSTLILGVCVTSLITWFVLLYQLIVISEGKGSKKKYLVLSFLIPYLNALWIPWALISSNVFMKKAQENYYKANAYEAAISTQILSIPLLILYLFWGVIGYIMRNTLISQLHDIEVLLPIGIVVVCVLIVALTYLINLSIFVGRMRKHLRSNPKYK